MSDQPGSQQRRQPLDPTKRSSFGTSPAIFISYRRDDAAGSSGRLYDRLVAKFGEDRVFMDIDTIHAGEPFAVRIEEALANCAACVVVIGRTWESITTPNGSRRLDDPTDFVRLEVAGALRSGARVFPVLVDGGSMPPAGSLPEDIRDLAGLQAIPLRGDSWNYDVGRLMLALDQALGVTDDAGSGGTGPGGADRGRGGTSNPTPPRRLGPVAIGVIVALLIALAGGIAWLTTRSSGTATTLPSATASTSPSSSVSTSQDCIPPRPSVTSGSAPRLDGLYRVDMRLTCFHGDLGTNTLWKNPDPQVGETHWMDRVWRFTQECVSGSCHAKWEVPDRRGLQGVLSRSGTTYNGASPGSAHCGVDPQSEQTPVTRQLQLTVSRTDGSGLATGFDGWMTISWTCDDNKVSGTFELAGTRTSS